MKLLDVRVPPRQHAGGEGSGLSHGCVDRLGHMRGLQRPDVVNRDELRGGLGCRRLRERSLRFHTSHRTLRDGACDDGIREFHDAAATPAIHGQARRLDALIKFQHARWAGAVPRVNGLARIPRDDDFRSEPGQVREDSPLLLIAVLRLVDE